MEEKVFRTFNQQLKGLRKKNLIINNGASAKKTLMSENYYTVINGYKDLFLDSSSTPENDVYKHGARFEEIVALYRFDCQFRETLLHQLLIIEHHAGTVISYVFSRHHGYKDYLRLENFDTTSQETNEAKRKKEVGDKIGAVAKLFAILHEEISKSTTNDCIAHYLSKEGYIPLWVLVSILSFGELSKFFRAMREQDRQEIAGYFGVSEGALQSFLSVLTLFRNRCAHAGRVYSFKTRQSIQSTILHAGLGLTKNANGQYDVGRNDILAVLLCIKTLCTKKETKVIVRTINSDLSRLATQLNVIKIEDVMRSMGLPDNWADIVDP